MMRLLATLALVGLLLSGCNRAPYLPYHSTASIPHFSRSQMTEMTFIRGDEDMMRGRRFAVIAAVDDGDLPYVLIAPAKPNRVAARRLDEALVARGAPIPPDKAAALVEGLDGVLRTWRQTPQKDSGFFYEFMHAPEQDISRVSENVDVWRPALRVNYSHAERGPVAALAISDGTTELTWQFELRDREQVEDLRDLVQSALRRLPSPAAAGR